MKEFWRKHLGIGPGDTCIDINGNELLITNIYSTNIGLALDYTSWTSNAIENGTLYELWRTIDWNKTTLFDENGIVLKRCKRKNINYESKDSLIPYGIRLTPKRQKINGYYILEPGTYNTKPIIYKPEEFFNRFDVIN